MAPPIAKDEVAESIRARYAAMEEAAASDGVLAYLRPPPTRPAINQTFLLNTIRAVKSENRCAAARDDIERTQLRCQRHKADRAHALMEQGHRSADESRQRQDSTNERGCGMLDHLSREHDADEGSRELQRRHGAGQAHHRSASPQRPAKRRVRLAAETGGSGCISRSTSDGCSPSAGGSTALSDVSGSESSRELGQVEADSASRAQVRDQEVPPKRAHAALGHERGGHGEGWAFDEKLHARLSQGHRRGRGGVGSRVFEQGPRLDVRPRAAATVVSNSAQVRSALQSASAAPVASTSLQPIAARCEGQFGNLQAVVDALVAQGVPRELAVAKAELQALTKTAKRRHTSKKRSRPSD